MCGPRQLPRGPPCPLGVTVAQANADISHALRHSDRADPLRSDPKVLRIRVCSSSTKWAISPTTTDAANMLFHVVNERHRRHRAMIFTTNNAAFSNCPFRQLGDSGGATHIKTRDALLLQKVVTDRLGNVGVGYEQVEVVTLGAHGEQTVRDASPSRDDAGPPNAGIAAPAASPAKSNGFMSAPRAT